MKFTVLTLFPDLVDVFFNHSIMGRAVEDGKIEKSLVNIRDFAYDKHKNCDDSPYGGGVGMLLKPEPISLAMESLPVEEGRRRRVIFPSPAGKLYTQADAQRLADEYDELVFICGRYEGVDQRIIDMYVDEEFSLGDYVLSSGENATLVLIDTIYRLCPGVIKKESLEEESFVDGLLEYPHYTKPAMFQGRGVPEVLQNGHHAKIAEWRYNKRIEKTKKNRPDLYQKFLEENHGCD